MPAERAPRPRSWRWLPALAVVGCDNETLITNFCPADIVINEIAAASSHDWVELFNANPEPVDLEGFYIWSTDHDEDGFTLPAVTLDDGGFLLLIADTYENEADPHIVLGFDLNRDGGHLELDAPSHFGSAACDIVIYPDQHDNFTWARAEDGGDRWCDAAASTKGLSNNEIGCLCEAQGDPSC